MTTQIKAGVIAANAITASELASSALSGGTFTGDVTFDTTTLVVDSTNNRVGVGVASPRDVLDVYGGLTLTRTNDTAEYALLKQDTTGDAFGIFTNGGAIRFGASGFSTEHMRITSSGALGIDNTGPSSKLHLGNNSTSGDIGLGIQNSTRYYTINLESGNLIFKDQSAAAERLRITSTGDSEFKGNIAFTKQDGMTISGYESLVMQINSQNNQSSRVFQVNNYTTPLFIVNQTGIIDARLPFKFHSTTSDPSITDEGSVYWNSTDKKFKYYTGSGWVNLTTPDLTAIPGLDVWADVTEGIAGTTVPDLSGNGAEGTAYNASHVGSLGGVNYYNCNSSSGSWITYDRNDFNDYSGDVTFFFVMTNRSSYSSEGSFITQNYQAATGYHIIRHSGTSDDFQTYTSNGSQNFTSTNTGLPVNASYNEGVIIIFSIGSSSNWSIYKKENGSEGTDTFSSITASQFNFNSNTNAIRIGNSQWAGEYLNAGIFAWGIIDHEITASERQIIYDYYARKGIAV